VRRVVRVLDNPPLAVAPFLPSISFPSLHFPSSNMIHMSVASTAATLTLVPTHLLGLRVHDRFGRASASIKESAAAFIGGGEIEEGSEGEGGGGGGRVGGRGGTGAGQYGSGLDRRASSSTRRVSGSGTAVLFRTR